HFDRAQFRFAAAKNRRTFGRVVFPRISSPGAIRLPAVLGRACFKFIFPVVLTVLLSNARGAAALNLFAWSEYVPQAVVDGFTRETGIKVNYETYSSGEEMLSKLLAGGASYDLIQPPDYIAEALIRNKLLRPLDRS